MTTIGTRLATMFRGRLVGHDKAGNAYYEDRKHRPGSLRRRRWVIYAGRVEASAVAPEWWGWLHHTSDAALPPTVRKSWQTEHQANPTGTALSYRPPGHDYEGGRRARAPGDYEAWSPDA